ncbi:hypothetical protein DFR29_10662 [Tahibacter aquaticus]|uniref:Uncharacterized protein n=1 Tax=Tahibacter aquaticus TaxID=520092 RepID=A0A4V3DMC6_9GAMM|nr:hypothetical protein [Tahibacter aquaticus]TDR43920.1 hypothetical protein DFR29_10662 [Tahibacter aquaticus]
MVEKNPLRRTNPATGAYLTSSPPIWATYPYDTETGKYWSAMTNAERVASAITDPDLIWSGLVWSGPASG